jgi:phage FluMu gp28-like protein
VNVEDAPLPDRGVNEAVCKVKKSGSGNVLIIVGDKESALEVKDVHTICQITKALLNSAFAWDIIGEVIETGGKELDAYLIIDKS